VNLDKAVEVLNEFGHEWRQWTVTTSSLGNGAQGRMAPSGHGNQRWADQIHGVTELSESEAIAIAEEYERVAGDHDDYGGAA